MKILLTLFLLIFTFQISFGQEKQSLKLVDSFSELNCEDLLVRLDGFNIEIFNHPNSKGYILIKNGENQLDNVFYHLFIKDYVHSRKIPQEKSQLISVKGDKQINIEFWMSEGGEKPNFTEENFNYKLNETKSHYFVEESVELAKIDGKNILIGDCSACCIRTFSSEILANFLNANPNLDAKIIIYTKNPNREFNKVAKIIVDKFREEKIPQNRLKIVSGKKKDGLYLLDYHISVLSVSLIPNKKLN